MKLTDLIENEEGMGPRKNSRYGEWLFNVRGVKPFDIKKTTPYVLHRYLPDRSETGFTSDEDALAAAPSDHDSHWQIINTASEEVVHEPEWWYQFHWLKRRQAQAQ